MRFLILILLAGCDADAHLKRVEDQMNISIKSYELNRSIYLRQGRQLYKCQRRRDYLESFLKRRL